MPNPDAHHLSWMPFQAAIIQDNTHREILLSGAYGSAKTRTLCGRAVWRVQHPKSRICITRKTHTSLLATTVRTLLEPDGDLPPVLPPGTYDYQQMKGRLHVRGGGELVFRGCDNQLQLGSEQFSDILVDEGIETDESEYIMLLGRMRLRFELPDGSENFRSICTATNPGDPSHYLYTRFYSHTKPNRLCVESNTAANYYLPDDYKESLNELHGVFRDRYYLGMWVAFEGAIFPMFLAERHILHNWGPFDHYVAGVDCGLNHPNVVRVHGCWMDSPRSHVVSEFHERGVVSPKFVSMCVEGWNLFRPMTFVIDSAAADVAEQMREAGLNVVLAEKDVLPGIRGLQNDLVGTDIGGPLLTMEPTCTKGNEEYPLYRWQEDREEPVKTRDDAIDADRYARNYIRKGFACQQGLVMLGRRGGMESAGPIRKKSGMIWDPTQGRPVPVHEGELDIDDERLWGRGDCEIGERMYVR